MNAWTNGQEDRGGGEWDTQQWTDDNIEDLAVGYRTAVGIHRMGKKERPGASCQQGDLEVGH